MKKMLAILLAVALVASLCTTAFAADAVKNVEIITNNQDRTDFVEDAADVNIAENGDDADSATTSQDVTLFITDPHVLVEEYCITVAFDDLKFTYTWGATAPTWNENTHEYDVTDAQGAKWVGDGDIKVTNHSNRQVEIDAYFGTAGTLTATEDKDSAITATIADNFEATGTLGTNETLLSADTQGIYGVEGGADYVQYLVSVAGKPANMTTALNGEVIGTVTISITGSDAADNLPA